MRLDYRKIGDTTILSLQYYLPRVDKVFMSKDSVIQIVKGAPNTRPQPTRRYRRCNASCNSHL